MSHHSPRQRWAPGRSHLPTSSMEQHQSAMHSARASAGSVTLEGQCWAAPVAAQLDCAVCWQSEMHCELNCEQKSRWNHYNKAHLQSPANHIHTDSMTIISIITINTECCLLERNIINNNQYIKEYYILLLLLLTLILLTRGQQCTFAAVADALIFMSMGRCWSEGHIATRQDTVGH